MNITLLAAVHDKTYGIGAGPKLLYRNHNDLRFFQQYTYGKTVVVGRKTFETLPELKDRNVVVVSRTHDNSDLPNVTIVPTIFKALLAAKGEVVVIGGGEIYKAALPYANKLLLTMVDKEPQVSPTVFFPRFNISEWTKREILHLDDGFNLVEYVIKAKEFNKPVKQAVYDN